MKKKDLTKDEINNSGARINKYHYLSKNNITINFKNDLKNILINVGNIPKIFKKRKIHPKKIDWLSIDLNSSKPTLAVLNFFYNKLNKNGIILLDDYGGSGYRQTKKIVDIFFKNKPEQILQIPTGQAIIIKK